jgi:hypothetical protein
MRRHLLWVLLLAMLGAPKAYAQRVAPPLWRADPPPAFAPSTPTGLAGLASREVGSAPTTVYPTYWKEGGIVGAILVGLAGAAVAGGLCGSSETNQGGCTGTTVGGLVVGGLTGFGLGALIGGQFRKQS